MFKINNEIEVGNNKLLLIAGPCIIENLEVCLEIGFFLKKLTKKYNINYIFKASFDKANRTSGSSFRGLGFYKSLNILSEIKSQLNLPIITDVHEQIQVKLVAEIVDVIQIPAFLCRQTDLLRTVGEQGKAVNIKKGQFMAPEDMKGAIEKVTETGNHKVMVTERGTSFGYHNLVVDMKSFKIMRSLGVPVVFDATHSVQLPGKLGDSSGGQRDFVETLSLSAVAAGIDALFMEIHPYPEKALSDGINSLNFKMAENLLLKIKNLYEFERKSFKN